MRRYELRPPGRAARWWAALALGALTTGAQAYGLADYPIRSEFGANQTLNNATHYTKGWTAAADGVSGVKVGSTFTMKAPGGRAVNASLLNTMSRNTAARVMARGLAGATWLGVGFAAYDLYNAIRVREKPEGQEGLAWDPGLAATVENRNVWCQDNNVNNTCWDTVDLAKAAYNTGSKIAAYAATRSGCAHPDPGAVVFIESQSATVVVFNFYSTYGCNGTPGQFFNQSDSYKQLIGLKSKAIPTCSGDAPGYDGRCPTGTYTVAQSADEAASRRALAETAGQVTPWDHAQLALALGDLWERTPVNIEQLDGAPQVQDIGNVAGGISKVTQPDGTTVTTATEWDFQPYGLTKGFGYAASGAWDENKTTVTCPGGGTQCTTETTTTENDPQGEGEEGPGSDDDPETDFCKENPTRAGCVELGDMPTDAMPRTSLALAYSAETISLPSGCPADVALPRGQVFSYATACNAATLARPLVIAAAAITALWICVAAVGGTRGSA